MSNPDVNASIREAVKQSKFGKVANVAQAVGMTYDRLSNIMNGKVAVKDHEIEAIRKTLELPPYWPEHPPHLNGAMPGERVSLSGTPLIEIPVVGSASAGPGVWNVDTDRKTVKVPASLADIGTIGFIVEGDSMMPMLEESDTAVFKKATKKLHGYIFLLRTPADGDIVKRVIYERGDWYILSLNKNYPRQHLPVNTEFVGLLVAYYRVRGKRELMEVDADGLLPWAEF